MMVDIFLKMDGIEGESTDPRHSREIEVLSFNWSENNTTPSGGSGTGPSRANMNDLSVQMPNNKASPKLFLACANGQHIKSAVLTIRKPGSTSLEYLKWTFTDTVVTSYGTAIIPGDQKPTDHITLNFRKIEVEYMEIRPDGTLGLPITASWDITANRPA